MLKSFIVAASVVAAAFAQGCGIDDQSGGYGQASEALRTTAGRKPDPAPTWALKATDAYAAGVTLVWKTSFTIATTDTLFVAAEVTGVLSGHHTQSIFLIMPGGSAYQRLDVAFATDTPAWAGEQQAERTATGWRVWVSIPVAATMITQMNLVGTWSASTYVDGAANPNASTTFKFR